MNLKFTFLPLIVLVFFSCAKNPVTGKKELLLMSESQELSLGKQSDPSIVAEYGLYNDAKLQAFIDEKGKQMASISHRPNLPYSFKILDSPVVNAFAVPGGYVYFTRGIMAHFNNEAEFAGVLGHEIGHITAKHAARQQSSQILSQLGLSIGTLVSDKFKQVSDLAQQGLSILYLSHSRAHETESDELGVNYSTKIGYNSYKMAEFFKTLEKLSGDSGKLPTFMSTHPNPGDRYNHVNALTKIAQQGIDPALLKENRDDYLRRIDGIVYGEDPKNGFVENNTFFHPMMKFKFAVPKDWQTANSPSQVQMGTTDGKAVIVFSVDESTNLATAKENVIKKNNFNVLQSENIKVNNLPAISIISDVLPQAGQQNPNLKVMTYLIEYNKMIFKFHGVSSTNDFNTYVNSFKNTMSSFNHLTDLNILNRKPTTIHIVEVSKRSTLQDIISSYNMPSLRYNELALLNGMNLTDVLEKGTLIKIFGGHY